MVASTQLIKDTWQELFTMTFSGDVKSLVVDYPLPYQKGETSLSVGFFDVFNQNQAVAEALLNEYEKVNEIALTILKDTCLGIDSSKDFNEVAIKYKDIPKSNTIPISEIGAFEMGRLIAINGLVSKTTQRKVKVSVATFACQVCGVKHRVRQMFGGKIQEPFECGMAGGGCNRGKGKVAFRHIPEESTMVNFKIIEVQENPDDLENSAQPHKLTCYLEGEMTWNVLPGDKVCVVGKLSTKDIKNDQMVISSVVMEGNNVIHLEGKPTDELEITDAEEEEIKVLSQRPDIYELLTNSIAPKIYGMVREKTALLLQQFSGSKTYNGERNQIHILLVGDPSTGKSQLLSFIHSISTRSILTSGQASTKAGLTAAAVRDELDGRFTLEAGAMVLADKGFCCIDELEKMRSEDRSSLHDGMAQQRISISKAGIVTTLNTRCSILAAANPKSGRFEDFTNLADQINLTQPLLTRFDVIFPVRDIPNRERDSAIVRHILRFNTATEELTGPLGEDMLKKYIAYAKENCNPTLPEDSVEIIEKFYVDTRNNRGQESEGVASLTTRQVEALFRLSTASAKVRLSPVVEVSDIERAISLVEGYIRGLSGGSLDADIIETGATHSQQERCKLLKEIINTLNDINADLPRHERANTAKIVAAAKAKGISEPEVDAGLSRLSSTKEIYQPNLNIANYKVA